MDDKSCLIIQQINSSSLCGTPPFFFQFFIIDMSQFSLSSANSHWGYSTTSSYPPYLGSTVPAACTTPTAAQFNNPALGFSCSPTETSSQDFAGSRDCVPSKKKTKISLL